MTINNLIVWSPGVPLEVVEEQIIKRALTHFRGNKTATAASLGIAIRTLDNKLEKYFEDDQRNEERMNQEKTKREQFLMRCRGKLPPAVEEIQEVPIPQEAEQDFPFETMVLKSKKRG